MKEEQFLREDKSGSEAVKNPDDGSREKHTFARLGVAIREAQHLLHSIGKVDRVRVQNKYSLI